MQRKMLKDKYPVVVSELPAVRFGNMNQAIEYFRDKIEQHPVARFISVFDHAAHTRALADGEIADEILEASNVVLCFGKKLPSPELLAVRPRSIGICRTTDKWVVSFMDAPNPTAQEAMEKWVAELE